LLGEDNISNSKINIKLEYLFIIEIFLAILNLISIGILYPFFLYLRYALVYSKTQIDGYKLVFKGNIFVFYFHYLWWYFLTIITLGIYHFFLEYKLYKWVVKNIYFDNRFGDSYFSKDIIESFLINMLCNAILILTLGLGYPFIKCIKYRWRIRNTYISGIPLRFIGDSKELTKKYLGWISLTILTLGLFAIFWGVLEEKYRIENTIIAQDEKEMSESEVKESEALNYIYLNVNKTFFNFILVLFYITLFFIIIYLLSYIHILLFVIDIMMTIEFIYIYDIVILFLSKLFNNRRINYFIFFLVFEVICLILSLIFISLSIGILLLNIFFISLISAFIFYFLLYRKQTYH